MIGSVIFTFFDTNWRKMQYKMFEFFNALQDPRREQGQRHKLKDVLTIVIMAILSGHQGLRGFARFAKANEVELTEILKLKHGVPCFFTIRAILIELNEQVLVNEFIRWVQGYLPDSADDFVSLDGKAIKSTTQGGNTNFQNFVAVVNAFGHRSGLVYGMKSYENGKSAEGEALRNLVKQLGLQDTVFTMDALHAQKKR